MLYVHVIYFLASVFIEQLSERQRGHIVDMYITSHCNLHAEHTFVDFIKEHEAELPIIFETPLLPDGTRWSSS